MRFFGIVCVLALVAGSPLSAQEAFEISVYPYATAHRGEWEVEGHLNYSSRGTRAFAGSVAPTQGPVREFEFEPKARAAVDISRTLTLGAEYYGSLGETRRWHQFYPTANLRLGDDLALHLGVGFGTTAAADRLVFKTAFEMPLSASG